MSISNPFALLLRKFHNKQEQSKNFKMWSKFFYKISKDLLIASIITYFLITVPELILPGIVSVHFSPKYLIVFIMLLGLAVSWQGRNFSHQENIKFKAISRNLLNIILFIVTLMLILSLYKMRIWQIITVTVISIAIFIALEKILVREE